MNYDCIKCGHCCREVKRTQTTLCASGWRAGRGRTPALADSTSQPFFRDSWEHTEQLPLQKTTHDPLHQDAFLSLKEQCPSQWWKNFKKKKFSRLYFLFFCISPSVLRYKTSDSPKKGIGLIVFYFPSVIL